MLGVSSLKLQCIGRILSISRSRVQFLGPWSNDRDDLVGQSKGGLYYHWLWSSRWACRFAYVECSERMGSISLWVLGRASVSRIIRLLVGVILRLGRLLGRLFG